MDALTKMGKRPHFFYLGSNSGMEEKFCRYEKIPFKAIATGKLRRYFSLKNFVDVFKIPLGVLQAFYHIKKFNPDVIFSKGGYVAIPVVAAGAILRKKIVIHESDFTPGMSTKISALFAEKICVPHISTKEKFLKKIQRKVVVTGNPVREEILSGSIRKAFKFLNVRRIEHPVLLVMGGSTGAREVNETIWKNFSKIVGKYTVIHVTGKGKGLADNAGNPAIEDLWRCIGNHMKKRYFEFKYIGSQLKDIYAVTDLVICRSGAGTVSEINALGLRALYLPLGGDASRGDQWENAAHMGTTPNIILDLKKIDCKILLESLDELSKKKRGKKLTEAEVSASAKKIAELLLS